MGLFEPAANLIEEFDLIISEKGNDVAAFAEAYMAILGAEVDEDGVKRIRDDRIINIYGTDDAKDVLVQFLTKPTADGTQENLLDRLQDLIFVTCMVANISDENFGNNASGISLAYKLLAMDNLAKTFDRKVSKSLSKRYKIFCSLSTNANNPNAWEDAEITFHRNLPKNVAREIENAKNPGIADQPVSITCTVVFVVARRCGPVQIIFSQASACHTPKVCKYLITRIVRPVIDIMKVTGLLDIQIFPLLTKTDVCRIVFRKICCFPEILPVINGCFKIFFSGSTTQHRFSGPDVVSVVIRQILKGIPVGESDIHTVTIRVSPGIEVVRRQLYADPAGLTVMI